MSSRNAALEPTAMLTFCINRAGKTLPKTQRARLEGAMLYLNNILGWFKMFSRVFPPNAGTTPP